MSLDTQFRAIGARLVLNERAARTSVDVRTDRKGEFFVLALPGGAQAQVLEVSRRERHLVLLIRDSEELGAAKAHFLCGHDERHYFVAAIPEARAASSIAAAREALKPAELREVPVRKRQRARRKTNAYRRQGEWFFVPARGLDTTGLEILRNEPIRRGRGKPHRCEQLVRRGGEIVYVNRNHPNGLTADQRERASQDEGRGEPPFRAMHRAAEVYVRGRISHPDHRTINLHGWHRVLVNAEHEARARADLAFLD